MFRLHVSFVIKCQFNPVHSKYSMSPTFVFFLHSIQMRFWMQIDGNRDVLLSSTSIHSKTYIFFISKIDVSNNFLCNFVVYELVSCFLCVNANTSITLLCMNRLLLNWNCHQAQWKTQANRSVCAVDLASCLHAA